MTAKAFQFFAMSSSQRKAAAVIPEASQDSAYRPIGTEINDGGEAGINSAAMEASMEEGAFRCRTCLRGPPLTKKYAKN